VPPALGDETNNVEEIAIDGIAGDKIVSPTISMATSSHVSRANFEAVFPSLVEDVSQAAKQYNIPTNALEWFQKVNHPEKLY